MSLPTFLVIGAQKAATTTLYELLRRHPDIYLPPDVKETSFLLDEVNWHKGVAWYESLFEPGAGHRHRGECSPAYTIFPRFRHCPERAASLMPDARLVYLIRHPVERMVSAWVQLVGAGFEHRPLDVALRYDAGYAQTSSYALQLDRWLARYDRDQLLVVRSDDLAAEPGPTLDLVLAHLGLDTGWRPPELGQSWNTSDEKTTVPGWCLRAGAALQAAGAQQRALAFGPKGAVGRRFRRPIAPEATRLDPDLAADLSLLFRDDLARLREIVGPDLDLWGLA